MEEFIKTITEQIRYEKVRNHVARELSDHISDQAQAYEASGESHEKALERAVREMGDPVEIGVALDRIHRPRTDWRMLVMAFAFSILGLIIMCTVGGLSEYYSVGKQCFFTVLGFGVMMGIYFLDYSFIGKYGIAVYLAWTAVFILYSLTGQRIHGRVPALSIAAYLYAPIFAGVLYRFRGKGCAAVCKSLALLLLTVTLVGKCAENVPATVNLYLICSVLLVFALWDGWFRVSRKWTFVLLFVMLIAIPALMTGYILCFGAGYQAMRLRAFLNPQAYAAGAGYLYNIIQEILANVRWVGGMPVDEASVSSVIMHENVFLPLHLAVRYGLLTGFVPMLAFALFIVRAAHITVRQQNRLGRMVAAACVLVFFVNCIEGLFLNVGLYPISSITLPFLSHGGAATLTYAVLIGFLLSVCRHEKLVSDSPSQKEWGWRLSVKPERHVNE